MQKDVAVYAEPNLGGRRVRHLRRGDVVTTARGIVVTKRAGTVELLKPLPVTATLTIPAGETIRTLYVVGEGFLRFEHAGQLHSAFVGMYTPGVYPASNPAVRVVVAPEYKWWVELITPDGRRGWAVQNGAFVQDCQTGAPAN